MLRKNLIAVGGVAAMVGLTQPSVAAVDLAAVAAVPQRGQSADQTRRDRYECHNWAVEETGSAPRRFEPDEDSDLDRAERVDRVITGAGVGAAVGGLARATQDKNPSNGVLSGAAIGAAIGALIGRRKDRDVTDPEFDDYFRALSACLEGRGYQVVVETSERVVEE
jgi:hypothetical protein